MSRAVVTGGASGIGAATVRRLRREGMRVAALDTDRVRLAGVDAEAHVVADVTAEEDVRRGVDEAAAALGGLDVVVACAGVASRGTVADTTPEEWERVFAVNVRGVYLTAKAALPHLREAGGGALVVVASQLGLVAAADAAAYCASKGAAVMLTRAMAVDHGADGIRVNCVCPGPTDDSAARGVLRTLDRPCPGAGTLCGRTGSRSVDRAGGDRGRDRVSRVTRCELDDRRGTRGRRRLLDSLRRDDMAVITGKDEELLIGGRWVAAESGERFDVTNPATGETVGTVPDGSEEDVRAAIDAAAEHWRDGSPSPRSSAGASCAAPPT